MTTESETAGGEKPICGFLLATGLMCYTGQAEPGKYCYPHEQEICAGCGQKAVRLCPVFVGDSRCEFGLCANCEHKEIGPHGPAVSASEQVRQGFISVVELSLKDAQSRGLVSIREGALHTVASVIVDDQSAHVMMQVLSGMANPR